MSWNAFKFCTALRALGSIMILLVLGIVGLSYYALVVVNYGPALFRGDLNSLTALLVLILFHSLLWEFLEILTLWLLFYIGKLVMLLWSYFAVVLTNPGWVPPYWTPESDEEKGDSSPLMASEYSGSVARPERSTVPSDSTNQIRFCRKCNQFKPPRCHHCSVCGRCVLKMDHHCVWVVNCVGAKNYKYFLLFLFYTFLETTLVSLSLLPCFLAFFSDGDITGTPGSLAAIFVTFILNLTFALSVMGFLILHLSLVAANTTTIEAYEKKTNPKWHYDLGRRRNFEQVFGMDKKYWFIPAYSEDDLKQMPHLQGLEYPMRSDLNGLQEL